MTFSLSADRIQLDFPSSIASDSVLRSHSINDPGFVEQFQLLLAVPLTGAISNQISTQSASLFNA